MIQELFQPAIAYATSTLDDPWPNDFTATIFTDMTTAIGLFSTPIMTILTFLGIAFVITALIRAIGKH